MSIKKIASLLHLWLGLLVGIIVILSLLPAAVYVWEKELSDWYFHKYIFVEPTGKPEKPLSELLAAAQKSLPADQPIESVEVFSEANRATVFIGHEEEEEPGWTTFSEMEYSFLVYVNPYTAEVTGIIDQETNWINLLRVMHQQLLLNYHFGHLVVGIATLIMFVMVFTGLILWWPKNKNALKQRFKIKFDAKWRRVNYDIHNVGGFYTQLFILIFAATGLVWTFEWWTDGIYRLLGDDPKTVFKMIPAPNPEPRGNAEPIDVAFADLSTKKEEWSKISFYLNTKRITGVVRYYGNSWWDTWDIHQYNPDSGNLFHSNRHEDKSIGAKWRNSNHAIHVGSIYGLPTKLVACFTALFCSSLPITGFYIWWGRRKKAPKTKKAKTKLTAAR